MGKLTLIIGGARSGKSTYAQRLAEAHAGRVVYLATAQALDEEMRTRIDNHRRERPPEWQTLEIPLGLAGDVPPEVAGAGLVLLDCLTLLVTNLVLQAAGDLDHPDEAAAEAAVDRAVGALLAARRESGADWIVVTNEVGLGLVPPYPVGRLFRDLLGRANQRLAALADEVYWLVAGIPVPIHGYRDA